MTSALAKTSDLSTVRAVFGPTMVDYMKMRIYYMIKRVMLIER
jgi:hypothetical protein